MSGGPEDEFRLQPAARTIRFSEKQDVARAMLTRQRYSCVAGGTRSGKTFLIVRAIVHRALRGEYSRHAILRFRNNAARASISLDTLPNVMRYCFPGVKIKEHRQDGYFEFENGSTIWIGGLDDKERVEKILGQEYSTMFLNEASQIPYSSAVVAFTRLAQVVPGLTQRIFVDLNPVGKSHWTNKLFNQKLDPVSGRPLGNPEDYALAYLNPNDNRHNLSAEFLKSLVNLPEKQRKRFYEGLYVDEVENALWSYENIEKNRVTPQEFPVSQRASVCIAVDPSGARDAKHETADEIGIVAAARGFDNHGYILDDLSLRDGPAQWARAAVDAYHFYKADCIVAESNFGGAMVEATIRSVDANVPVTLVNASRGKAVRAEPIAARYARDEVHHVGKFDVLEDQMCAFSNKGYSGSDSPDHADAAVWALTHLIGGLESYDATMGWVG